MLYLYMMQIPELKPHSPDFNEKQEAEVIIRPCDIPGCPGGGDFKAPKSRALNEYYFFCMDHVREYNQNWNFFEGMSQKEIETHMYRTMTWDRPTWESTIYGVRPDHLRQRVYEGLRMDGLNMGSDFNHNENTAGYEGHYSTLPAPEMDALSTLGLSPPINWDTIRTQYKKMVKKHHPDVSQNKDRDAEIIKKINIAYSILKVAYQKFEKLDPA